MPNAIQMTPARLVGLGFRGWVAGYEYQDTSCWENVWETYSVQLGAGPAKRAITELSAWVRVLRQTAERRIEIYPAGCMRFCRDECIAIAVIAACQQNACPALHACAEALIGTGAVEPMLKEARAYGDCLLEAGQCLSAGVIYDVAEIGCTPCQHRSTGALPQ